MTASPAAGLTAGAWLQQARMRLETRADQAEENDSQLSAQVLLAHVIQHNRAWIIAHPEAVLAPGQQAELERLLGQLLDGTPLPYLLGRWEFFGLEFEVTPAVLIPRPETELLVEFALSWLAKRPQRRRAADVGAGSGAIAISLAKQVPGLRVLAVDRSWQALQVTRRNAQRHGVASSLRLLLGDLLTAASGPLDLVCANLPYIPSKTLEGLAVSRHEPRAALDGGPDGLTLIRALLADAPRWLAPGGLLLLEMQFDQGDAVRALASDRLPGARVRVLPDLAGLPRLVVIEALE